MSTLSARAQALFKMYEQAKPNQTPFLEAEHVATVIRAQSMQLQYEAVSKALGGKIPPWFIGVLHYRENSAMSLRAYLGNGELIVGSGERTSIVPVGRGPFKTFVDGAIDALKLEHLDKETSWSTPECLERAERWNGLGYMALGVVNPYLFAGTNLYKSGKYIADGTYSSKKVDKQLGVALLMKALKIS